MIDDPDYQQLVETAHAWRERMGANDVSSEDVDEFDAWLHADFRHKYVFRQAQEYWAEVGQIGVDQLDDRLVASLATESSSEWFSRSGKKVNDTVKRRFKPLVVMAVLVVLVVPGIIFLYPPFTNTGTVNTADPLSFVSAKGEFSQQVLQDGSVINLSADTEVIVQFDANERLVVLNQGAVLFEVSHDPNRPFLVKTGSLTAEALG
ncbi:MAG: FecR domain-containing protein, partial [Pseudomonadota bacterium]